MTGCLDKLFIALHLGRIVFLCFIFFCVHVIDILQIKLFIFCALLEYF